MIRKISNELAAIAFAVAVTSGPAWAACEVIDQGGGLTYLGGDITITALGSNANFSSELGLYMAQNVCAPQDASCAGNRIDLSEVTPFATPDIMDNSPENPAVVFDPGAFGIAPGPIVFGIFVRDTGKTYYMRDGFGNPDGVPHAIVFDNGDGTFDVEFEDQFDSGDCDFDDVNFRFDGGITQVPLVGIDINIGINPESDSNSINACPGEAAPVLIWGSDTLDVTLVDPMSLVFASSTGGTVGKSDPSPCSIADRGAPDDAFFDGFDIPDGFPDLTCAFTMIEKNNDLGDTSTEAQIRGAACDDPSDGCNPDSFDYFEIAGVDAVDIVKTCD